MQAGRTLRTLENILLLDLDHGELAARGAEFVALTGELLLSRAALFALPAIRPVTRRSDDS